MDGPTLTHQYHPGFVVYIVGIAHPVDLEKGIMTCLHHYVSHRIFSLALKSSMHCLFILSHPPCLVTTNFFTVSIVSPFPKCHLLGIIQYVATSDWLCSMHSRLLHTFYSLMTHFLLAVYNIPLLDVPQLIYPFIYKRTS